jgi:hypothetical protein
LPESLNTQANLARRVTFFQNMAFGKYRLVWRVLAKRLGKCQQVWRNISKWFGKCRRVWRVSHISEKGHFGECEYSPKTKQVLRSTILSSTIHFDLVLLISDLVRLISDLV